MIPADARGLTGSQPVRGFTEPEARLHSSLPPDMEMVPGKDSR